MKQFILFFLIGFILGLAILTSSAKAVVWTWNFICHCPPGNLNNCQTLRLPNSSYDSHLANHPHDYAGQCSEITPTPSIEPSPEPTVSPEPEITPSIVPTITSAPEKQGGSVEAPRCGDGNTVNVPANAHVIRDGSHAMVNFFVTEGDSADVLWKEVSSPNWQHAISNLKPNGDKFVSVDIGELNPNLGYTFGVRQRNGCGGGQTITAVIVDGPEPRLFTLSYWEVK